MSEDSNSPFLENSALAKMAKSVERIELRLVGDPELQSTGLVQEVIQLQKQQAETAKILERVVARLDEVEQKKLVARDDIVTKSMFRRWAVAACAIGPVLGGIITWLYNTGVVHFTWALPKHP